jgi:hydroxylamine reductase
MFCYQCEQAAKGLGCDKIGVCGKSPAQSDLQDVIFHALKGLAIWMLKAKEMGIKNSEVDKHTFEALFSIVTNVNFDEQRLYKIILKTFDLKQKIKEEVLKKYKQKNNKDFDEKLKPVADWDQSLQLKK